MNKRTQTKRYLTALVFAGTCALSATGEPVKIFAEQGRIISSNPVSDQPKELIAGTDGKLGYCRSVLTFKIPDGVDLKSVVEGELFLNVTKSSRFGFVEVHSVPKGIDPESIDSTTRLSQATRLVTLIPNPANTGKGGEPGPQVKPGFVSVKIPVSVLQQAAGQKKLVLILVGPEPQYTGTRYSFTNVGDESLSPYLLLTLPVLLGAERTENTHLYCLRMGNRSGV
jgi:hypothetical protein